MAAGKPPRTRWTDTVLLAGILISFIASNQVQAACVLGCGDYCDGNCVAASPPICPVIDSLLENTPNGTFMFNIDVTPPESELTLTGPDSSKFYVVGNELFVSGGIDREEANTVTIDVQCVEDPSEKYTHKFDVADVNEFNPEFQNSYIIGNVSEHSNNGTAVITDLPIFATDLDYGDRENLLYEVLDKAPFSFQLSACHLSLSGDLTLHVAGDIDFETDPIITFTIFVEDGCPSISDWDKKRNSTATVEVHILDIDDLPPVFSESFYTLSVSENDLTTPPSVGIDAMDQDTLNADINYSIVGQSGDWGCSDHFAIDIETAELSITKELDYEASLGPCNVTIQAVQADNCAMFTHTALMLTVEDVNECPRFLQEEYEGQISEDEPFLTDGGDRLMVGVTDEDLVFKGQISSESGDLFDLVPIESVDLQTQYYFIKFKDPSAITEDTIIRLSVYDSTTDITCLPSNATINITLLTDGLAPSFTKDDYYDVVTENSAIGTPIVTVSALNSDNTTEGITYRLQLVSDNGENLFDIDSVTGEISVLDDGIDAETVSQYTLLVEAVDNRGTYSRSDFASVIIDVIDENEYPPVFEGTPYELDILEEVEIGYLVLKVQATDLDIDSVLVYSIPDTTVPFAIDGSTGVISTTERLDRETEPSFSFEVLVSDGPNSDTAPVTITLLDINDNPPVFDGEPYQQSLPEDTLTSSLDISTSDADEVDTVTFTLESPEEDHFSLDETGHLSITGPFDYEHVKEYLLTVTATDEVHSIVTLVNITITDVNDNAPVFTTTCPSADVREDADVGAVVCTFEATDADEDGMAVVTFELNDPSNSGDFEISSTTGELLIKQSLNREFQDSYTLNVTATDGTYDANTEITISVIDVNDNPPEFENDLVYDAVFLVADELMEIPTSLYTIVTSDADLHPWNIVQCEKSSGSDSFVVKATEDGACEVSLYESLGASLDPYNVTFYAFNPDNTTLRSEDFTLSVYVREPCYITFIQDEYAVVENKMELVDSVSVVTVNATSNCNNDEIRFEISQQTYRVDTNADSDTSTVFDIDPVDGSIFPIDADSADAGEYVVTVLGFNESDKAVNDTTTVQIIITEGANTGPSFYQEEYYASVLSDEVVVVADLSQNATDPDAPSFGNGEIVFIKDNETDLDYLNITDYFDVTEDGLIVTNQKNLLEIGTGNFEVTLIVRDNAKEPLSDTAVLFIFVDIFYTPPEIVAPVITKDCNSTIEETDMANIVICNIDASSTYETEFVFGLDSSNGRFDIDADTGVITTNSGFDYDAGDHLFTLLAYAEGMSSGLRNYTTIIVEIIDINDNAPEFSEVQFEFSIEEDTEGSPCGKIVGEVLTSDADSPDNSIITYGTDSTDFKMVDNVLWTVNCIDRESPDYSSGKAEFQITAINVGVGGEMNQTSSVDVVIDIVDVNDNPPELSGTEATLYIEDSEVTIFPELLYSVQTTDIDTSAWNTYTLCEKFAGDDIFSVRASQDGECEVYTHEPLLMSPNPYIVSFYAYNPENPSLQSANFELTIFIWGNCIIVFNETSSEDVYVLSTDLVVTEAVVTLEVTSNCTEANIVFEIDSQTYQSDLNEPAIPSSDFDLVDNTEGSIYPTANVQSGAYVLTVRAYNSSDDSVFDITEVTITVTDDGNTAPIFTSPIPHVYVMSVVDVYITNLTDFVTEPDYPAFGNGEITFLKIGETKEDGTDTYHFDVDENGIISTTQDDLEAIVIDVFEVTVMVEDKAVEPLSNVAVVTIHVDIVGTTPAPPITRPPIFTEECLEPVEINEEEAPNDICDVDAYSPNEDVVYGLDPSSEIFFTINPTTGIITADDPFDYEEDERSYTILVYAEGETSGFRNYTSITVNILDVNDNAPQFPTTLYAFSMEEDGKDETGCEASLGLVSTTDADSEGNNDVTYITNSEDFEVRGQEVFAVNCINLGSPEYASGVANFTITASDPGYTGDPDVMSQVEVTVAIYDINDNRPEFDKTGDSVLFDEGYFKNLPVKLYTAPTTDNDVNPVNTIVMCEKLSGDVSFVVRANEGGSCEVYSYGQLGIAIDPYIVTFHAFNPDNPELKSDDFTLSVYVRELTCYIVIIDDAYDTTVLQNDLDESIPVVTINITSNCNLTDVTFNIIEQLYRADTTSSPIDSSYFTIDTDPVDASGLIYPSAFVETGAHSLTIMAQHLSDSSVNDTVMVEIIVTRDDNRQPSFNDTQYEVFITAESNEDIIDLSLRASDPDAPSFGNGEIVFSEDKESDLNTNATTDFFSVAYDGTVTANLDGLSAIGIGDYELVVVVQDQATIPLSETSVIIIHVNMLGTTPVPPIVRAPMISKSCTDTVDIEEESLDTFICDISGASEYEDVVFGLQSSDRFSIDSNTGVINSTAPFDYEKEDRTYYTILAYAEGVTSGLRNYTSINVNIIDINDNPPIFTVGLYEFSMKEDGQGATGCNTSLGTISSSDEDSELHSDVNYFTDNTDFVVEDGVVRTASCISITLDYPDQQARFYVNAADPGYNGPTNTESTVEIVVYIEDINDNPPEFEHQKENVFFEEEDFMALPFLLHSVEPTDADILPENKIVMCQKTGGDGSFAVQTTADGSCEVYTLEALSLAVDPYIVTFYAFNPDKPDLKSEDFTLSVYVRELTCYIVIIDDSYEATVLQDELDESIPVVAINITSNCNLTDVAYIITEQVYRADMTIDIPTPSSDFKILPDPVDGSGLISPVTTAVETGAHTLTVLAYSEYDNHVNDTVTVEIIVTTSDNQPPAFNDTQYERFITSSSNEDVMDLSLYASDEDYPSFGNGEIFFRKDQEIDMKDNSSTEFFKVTLDGKLTANLEDLTEIGIGDYELVVAVEDEATTPLSNTSVIIIHVNMLGTTPVPPIVRAPTISKSCNDTVNIEEESVETFICDIDGESDYEDVVFGLQSSERFSINPGTGEIDSIGPFNYDDGDLSFTVLAYVEGVTSGLRNYTSFTVIVVDINDNAPLFSESLYEFSMKEHGQGATDCTTSLGTISSTDEDSEEHSDVVYATDNSDFIVEGSEVRTVSCISLISPEYQGQQARFNVTATDPGYNGPTVSDSTVEIVVDIEDINDNPPEFVSTSDVVSYGLNDFADLPFLLYSVEPTDADILPENKIVMCQKISGHESVAVRTQDGVCEVYTYEALSVATDPYDIIFYSFNPDKPELESDDFTLSVYVRESYCYVTFTNDSYGSTVLQSQLDESISVVTVDVTSNCFTDNVMFQILSQNYTEDTLSHPVVSNNFTINTVTGEIYPTDQVQTGAHNLVVSAYNQSDPLVQDVVWVEIVVTGDENEAPYFNATEYDVTVTGDSDGGVIFDLGVRASDPDAPSFGTGEMIFIEDSETDLLDVPTNYFTVSESGLITITREDLGDIGIRDFKLDVTVQDKAVTPLSNSSVVIIHVNVIGTTTPSPIVSAPVVSKDCEDVVEIQEGVPPPIIICDINGTSPSEDVVFGIDYSSESFSIDTTTGAITTNRTFDYESGDRSFTILVYAEGVSSGLRSYTWITVEILDVNDKPPVFEQRLYEFSMNEDGKDPESDDCMTSLGLISATDADSVDTFYYETDDEDFVVIGNEVYSNSCISILSPKYANRTANFYITAVDPGYEGDTDDRSTVEVIVAIEDINDNAPEFDPTTDTVRLLENDFTNIPVKLYEIEATDDDYQPWNKIIQCEKTSGSDAFVVITTQAGVCEVNAYEALTVSPDPYTITFYAFNPDTPALRSDEFTLNVQVRDVICYIEFVEDSYDALVLQSSLEDDVAVVAVEVTGNCDVNDVVYEIEKQTYQADLESSTGPSSDFILDTVSGMIYPTNTVQIGAHILTVAARNVSAAAINDSVTVEIIVTGDTNEAPYFTDEQFDVTVTDDSIDVIIDLSQNALDDDWPNFGTGELVFAEVSENDVSVSADYFTVNPDGKVTTTSSNLQLIGVGTIQLDVVVHDEAVEPLNDTAVVMIHVDVVGTTNAPSIGRPPIITVTCEDAVEIEEESSPNFVCDIDATSSEENIVFGLDTSSEELFQIDTTTGEITTDNVFDYESDDRSFVVLAYAEGVNSALRSYTTITINIIDINDSPPEFSEDPLEFSMEENWKTETSCQTVIGAIQATDLDSDPNAQVVYSTDDEDFEVTDEQLNAVSCINLNNAKYSGGEANFNIIAFNPGFEGKHNLTSLVGVVVSIQDVNDNAPEFTNEEFTTSVEYEELEPGMLLFVATGEDEDQGPHNNKISFSLSDSQDNAVNFLLFQMSDTGMLSIRDDASQTDFEELVYNVRTEVSDEGSPPLSSVQTISVYITTDAVLQYPIFPDSEITLDVPENEAGCYNFTAPQTCNAEAKIKYDVSWSPESEEELFNVTQPEDSGAGYHQFCYAALDRETSGLYSVTVTAEYDPDNSICLTRRRRAIAGMDIGVMANDPNTITFTVTVEDDIDSPPQLSDEEYNLAAIDNLKFGTIFYSINATDEDEDQTLVYSMPPFIAAESLIVIDEMTGDISTDTLLYPGLGNTWNWKWEPRTESDNLKRTVSEYTVQVCDKAELCSAETPLMFKVLLSFEHIIITVPAGIKDVADKQDALISCIEDEITNADIQLHLQFISPVDDVTSDMWLYAVDSAATNELKYLEYKHFAAEAACSEVGNCPLQCDDFNVIVHPLRLSSVRPTTTSSSYVQWLPIVLAFIILIGNIICIIVLLRSWKQMRMADGRELHQEVKNEMGISNVAYIAGDADVAEEARYAEFGVGDYDINNYDDDEYDNTGSQEQLVKNERQGMADPTSLLVPALLLGNREYGSQEVVLDVYPFDGSDNGSLDQIQLVATLDSAGNDDNADPTPEYANARDPSIDYNVDDDNDDVCPGPSSDHVDEPATNSADEPSAGDDEPEENGKADPPPIVVPALGLGNREYGSQEVILDVYPFSGSDNGSMANLEADGDNGNPAAESGNGKEPSVDYNVDNDSVYENISPDPLYDEVNEPVPDSSDTPVVGYDYDTATPPKDPMMFQPVPQENGNPGETLPQLTYPRVPRPSLADEPPTEGKMVSFGGETIVGEVANETASDGGEVSTSDYSETDAKESLYKNL